MHSECFEDSKDLLLTKMSKYAMFVQEHLVILESGAMQTARSVTDPAALDSAGRISPDVTKVAEALMTNQP